jgi:hypothetical protein
MKKLLTLVFALTSLTLMASGCAVRAHGPAPVVAVRAPRPVVVVETPRPRPRPRRCYRNRCVRRCNIWGCWDSCRRVAYRCYR